MQLLTELRMNTKNKDITYSINFKIINKPLFNIINKFTNINNIYELEYKIIFDKSTLYL